MADKIVHYNRVTIRQARKLFDAGEPIYLWPVYDRDASPIDGIYIHVKAHKGDAYNLDEYINVYKSVSRKQMRYYTESFITQ